MRFVESSKVGFYLVDDCKKGIKIDRKEALKLDKSAYIYKVLRTVIDSELFLAGFYIKRELFFKLSTIYVEELGEVYMFSNGYGDFHGHSDISDGELSPLEYINRGFSKDGLYALSITDHDTIYSQRIILDNLDRIKWDRDYITGLELSVNFNRIDVDKTSKLHLICLGFSIKNERLLNTLESIKEKRNERGYRILELLRKKFSLDIPKSKLYPYEDSHTGILKVDIAKIMISMGIVDDIGSAFNRYLEDPDIKRLKTSPVFIDEAIDMINEAGGVCGVAHIYNNIEYRDWFIRDVPKYIEIFSEMGTSLIGIYHPAHEYSLSYKGYSLAKEFALIPTGGSDFHTLNRNFGRDKIYDIGDIRVPYLFKT